MVSIHVCPESGEIKHMRTQLIATRLSFLLPLESGYEASLYYAVVLNFHAYKTLEWKFLSKL